MTFFGNAKLHVVSRYPEGSPGTAGMVMTATFKLEGKMFYALNNCICLSLYRTTIIFCGGETTKSMSEN